MILIQHKKDKERAIEILTKEYKNAPNISWFIESNDKDIHYFFSMITDDAFQKKGAYISDNRKGVLLLYNLQNKYFSVKTLLMKLKVILFIIGIRKSIRLIKLQINQNAIRPAHGLYAQALAIENSQIRFMTGLEVKRHIFEIQNKYNLPVYAETTDPRLLRLYESVGFKIYHQMFHPYCDLIIWFLKLPHEIAMSG